MPTNQFVLFLMLIAAAFGVVLIPVLVIALIEALPIILAIVAALLIFHAIR